jgi:hypothetical protein
MLHRFEAGDHAGGSEPYSETSTAACIAKYLYLISYRARRENEVINHAFGCQGCGVA